MHLGHVALNVGDLDLMVSFYVDTIGLRVTDIGTAGGRTGAPRIAFLSAEPSTVHHHVAFLERPGDHGAHSGMNHLAFEVGSLDDLRDVWRRVQADARAGGLGTPAPVTAFQADQWSIRLSDPEGNGVEIYALTPWDARAAATPYSPRPGVVFEPFDLDRSDEELIAWAEQLMAELGTARWPRGQRPAHFDRVAE